MAMAIVCYIGSIRVNATIAASCVSPWSGQGRSRRLLRRPPRRSRRRRRVPRARRPPGRDARQRPPHRQPQRQRAHPANQRHQQSRGHRPGRHRAVRGEALRHGRGRSRLLPALVGPRHGRRGFLCKTASTAWTSVTRAVESANTAGGTWLRLRSDRGAGRHPAHRDGAARFSARLDGTPIARLERLLAACADGRSSSRRSRRTSRSTSGPSSCGCRCSAGMTSVTRFPIGVIVNNPALLAMLKAAGRVKQPLSRMRAASGFPPTPPERVEKASKVLPHGAKSSMLEDAGARPAGLGTAVAERRRRPDRQLEVGVDTPIHRLHQHGVEALCERQELGLGAGVSGCDRVFILA